MASCITSQGHPIPTLHCTILHLCNNPAQSTRAPKHCITRLACAGLVPGSSAPAEPAKQAQSAEGYARKAPHARSSAHQAWLTLLGLATSLLLALPREASIERLGVRLVVVGHVRLVQALQPPQGTPEEPLTLASLQVRSVRSACVFMLAQS